MSETVDLAQRYETVIGLECHIQLKTRSKIFCRCSTEFGGLPNAHVCPICLGHPGVLPVLNREAVAHAIRFGLAVGATIAPRSEFARKNYFYPDLPKGYQISQYEHPVLEGGEVRFWLGGEECSVRLVRGHLEEDAGKSQHPEAGREASTFIDLNRAGVPLLEVVTEPDLRAPEEAHAFLERVRQLVTYLGICDGNMEEGSLRADANISVRPRGQETLNPKTEIKNLNSFRNVERSLIWESKRQARLLEEGGTLQQATRQWDVGEGRTRVLRSKEDEQDYRYFPDPDLPWLEVDAGWIEEIKTMVPEYPRDKEHRLMSEYGLSRGDAVILSETAELADYYEATVAAAGDPKTAANWVINDVLHLAKEEPRGLAELKVTPSSLGGMIRLVRDGVISGKIAKTVFAELAEHGGDPQAVIEAKGLRPISDDDALDAVVAEVTAEHAGPAADYQNGKAAALQFLVGQVMRKTQGRADPQAARNALLRALGAPESQEKG